MPTRGWRGLTDMEANVIKQALEHWLLTCERKINVVRQKQHDAAEGKYVFTVSDTADVEYINTRLPMRMEAARDVVKDIQAGGDDAWGRDNSDGRPGSSVPADASKESPVY